LRAQTSGSACEGNVAEATNRHREVRAAPEGREGDRLLGPRRLGAYRDYVNGFRQLGKLFRD
jgi:hypothetical protein